LKHTTPLSIDSAGVHLIAAASVVVLALAIFAGVGLPGHHPSFKKTDVTSTTTTAQSGLSSGSGHRHRQGRVPCTVIGHRAAQVRRRSQQRRSTSTPRPTSRGLLRPTVPWLRLLRRHPHLIPGTGSTSRAPRRRRTTSRRRPRRRDHNDVDHDDVDHDDDKRALKGRLPSPAKD